MRIGPDVAMVANNFGLFSSLNYHTTQPEQLLPHSQCQTLHRAPTNHGPLQGGSGFCRMLDGGALWCTVMISHLGWGEMRDHPA